MAVQATLAWEEEGSHPRAQRGPVAGATTKFSLAPSIGVFGFVPVRARSIFSSSFVVVRAWRLAFRSSAVPLLAAALRRRVRCARRAGRRARAWCCRCSVAAAVAAAVCALRLSWRWARAPWGVRARWMQGARAGCPVGGGIGPVPSPWAGRGASGLAVCERPPCSCARDVVVAAAGARRRGRSRVPRRLVHAHGVAGGARGTAARGAVAVLAWRWR